MIGELLRLQRWYSKSGFMNCSHVVLMILTSLHISTIQFVSYEALNPELVADANSCQYPVAARICSVAHSSGQQYYHTHSKHKFAFLDVESACLNPVVLGSEGQRPFALVTSNTKNVWVKGTFSHGSSRKRSIVALGKSRENCDMIDCVPTPTFVLDQEVVNFLSQRQVLIFIFKSPTMMWGKSLKKPVAVIETIGAASGLVDPPQEILGTAFVSLQILEHIFLKVSCAASRKLTSVKSVQSLM